jgi:phosphoglycerate kinase
MANLLNKVNTLLIGGGMMYTFLKAKGLEIGDSLLEPDKVSVAQKTMQKAGTKLVLPVDCIIADNVSETAKTQVVPVDKIPIGWKGVDIGPETIRLYYGYIIKAQTIIWNGPMGIFEIAPFAKGTNEIAHAIADATKSGAVSVVGGGDTDAAVTKAGYDSDVTHISTGGGASLEMLEGKVLPGVAALTDK